MLYALRSPTTGLKDRRELSELIFRAMQDDELDALRDDPRVIYAWDDWPSSGRFCIYCNTEVLVWWQDDKRHFRHHWRGGGINKELCQEVARLLGMTPVYAWVPRPPGE